MMVERLFLPVPWGCLRFVMVVVVVGGGVGGGGGGAVQCVLYKPRAQGPQHTYTITK